MEDESRAGARGCDIAAAELAVANLVHGYAVFDLHDELRTEEPPIRRASWTATAPSSSSGWGEQWFIDLTTEPRASVPVTHVARLLANRSLSHAG